MIDDTVDYILYKKDSMQPDEWLTYLKELQNAVTGFITDAIWNAPSEIHGRGRCLSHEN